MGLTAITASSRFLLLFAVGIFASSYAVSAEQGLAIDQAWSAVSTTIWICIGLFAGCCLYGGFVSFTSKEPSHFYCSLTAIAFVWFWSQMVGLMPSVPMLPFLPVLLFIATSALFIDSFLLHSKDKLKLNKATVFVGLVLVALVLVWLLPQISIEVVLLLLAGLFGTAVYCCYRNIKRGSTSAVYCLVAYLTLAAALIYSLSLPKHPGGGLAPNGLIALAVGCALHMVFLAFALVSRFTELARRSRLSSESLEKMVHERTQQLQAANDDLGSLANDLRNASEAKNTFLVNMSHEMRTPLTAIIGYADDVLKGDIDETEKAAAIEVIRKNGDHLLHIITDILDISKIEAGTLEIESRPFDPIGLMQDVSQMVAKDVENKQLQYSVLYRLPLPCEMYSDEKRVRQILLNLLNNAVKFTHHGEIEVMVKVDKDKLVFSISDTGIGMNQEQLDQLFLAFKQEDLTKSRQYGGVGLGLSIAKSLADKLGAEIDVVSTQGQGSTFTVTFALGDSHDASWIHDQYQLNRWLESATKRHMESDQGSLPKLSGKVLLAEDHPDNQRLFVRLLQRMGLMVTAVDNGYQAVQATLEQDFDLVLMDIQMPEMDGIKALELIRSANTHVPVVALTANAMKADVDLYMSLGFEDHIAKPIDTENFTNIVTRYIKVDAPVSISIGDDEMDEIRQQFIVRLRQKLSELRAARASDNWDEIGRQAHAIKGSAGMFGYDELGKLGAELELAVKNADRDACDDYLAQLVSSCENITETL